ncbi:MAG: tRNA (adenosine(37)-N6)-dimethylallyltransferase MiaA [Lachnospiraceae bacterium]|nr:tRNA (adenosine(37)-N6)-dimethylallyltransferase MiaA [Lachnospiraceae bacterium]
MTQNKKPLIILTGPTAVGKTRLSVELAKQVNGEIISADSMQVYRGMDIGSAKVTQEEMQGVPHHLIDELEPWEEFHVVKFQQYAKRYIEEIHARGRIPILVGGTGFYIQAVLYNIDFIEHGSDSSYRESLERLAREQEPQILHDMLRAVDPESADTIHANNVKRVIRALEFYHATGEKISEHNEKERHRESPYQFVYFVLNDERAVLYDRIDRRVDKMMEDGLLDEVQRLQKMGCTREMVSMQGLGYKELLDYLSGAYTLEEVIRVLKRDTRHFAKRQLTWFRRERDVIWLDKNRFDRNEEGLLKYMLAILHSAGIVPAQLSKSTCEKRRK